MAADFRQMETVRTNYTQIKCWPHGASKFVASTNIFLANLTSLHLKKTTTNYLITFMAAI